MIGKPQEAESVETFEVEDIVIYIAKDVLINNLKNNTLYIYIEGYGRYALEIL